jgi:hypothetical protein
MEQLYITVHPYHIKHNQKISSVVGTVSGFISARCHGMLEASSKISFSALTYTEIMTIHNAWHYWNPREDKYNYFNNRQNHRNHWVDSGDYFERTQYD